MTETDDGVFARIVDALDVGIYVYRLERNDDPGSLRLVYANAASTTATGLDVATIIGTPLGEAFPALMQTDLPATGLAIARGGEARRLSDIVYEDDRVARRVFAVDVFPLPEQSVGIAFTNLTGQRGAELQATQTLEEMSDAFFTLDSEWCFTYLNPQTEPILERRRPDLLGKNMWEEFPEVIGTPFHEAYERAARDRVTTHAEASYAPLGRYIEMRAYPLPDGLAVYFKDVTTERRIADQLVLAQRLEAIGRVTASVAHDFNNLLAAIGGFAALGEAQHDDPASAGRYFHEISLASDRAVHLTRQLLAIGGQQELDPATGDLNEVVREFASLLAQLLPTPVELVLDLARQSVPVFADRSQLEQVLLNLVVNARDAIEEGGTISIRTSTQAPADLVHDVSVDAAWLQVTDTGSGIPPELAPRIFEPFFSTKPEELGTGLGLATIYGIVSQSHGDIYVESVVGTGTTMTVVLPAHASSPVTAPKLLSGGTTSPRRA
ncbi:MAG: PAS domain-containing protein [Actinobacteria bacterium]|nr:PAS domain-containing protein [Actinomycetota bacterium]